MASPRWTAVTIWTRADLRRRWRSWAILGLLAGVTLGTAAAGFAGARRTASAVPALMRAAHIADAGILANNPAYDAAKRAQVAALPEVQATYPFEIAFSLNVVRPAPFDSSLLPTSDAAARNLVGVLVAGRFPDPARANEVVVDENARRMYSLEIGSTMVIRQTISPAEVSQFPPGMIPRHVDLNVQATLRVVGIAKSVSSDPSWTVSSGFYTQYAPRLAGFVNEFATLRGGQRDLPRLQADVSRIVGSPVNVESTEDLDGIRKARNVTAIEREGLLLFALSVIIGGGVLVGQALVRAVTAGAAELPTLRSMGTDDATAVAMFALPAVVTAALAAVTAVVVAIALSSRFPLGLARRYDLDVGFHADWFVLGAAVAAALIAVLLAAVVAALWRATRGASVRPRVGRRPWSTRASLPPALDVGYRLAVEPGRGRSAVPVRSALIGAIVGVIGVVACLTFRAGLDSAVASPARSGVVWNFIVASGDGPLDGASLAAIAHDPAVGAAVEAEWARAVPVNGTATPTFGTRAVKSELPFVVLSGRAPTATDEIAFAPSTMHALHLHLGDTVTVGRVRHARVVGSALFLATSHTDYDQSGWMTAAGLHAAMPPNPSGPDDVEDYALIRWHPRADTAAAAARMAKLGSGDFEAVPATQPVAVVDLGALRTLPFALAVFFALLAAATVAHALVTTVRRRRYDLAVLRALGFTRRQSRIAIAWQATLLAVTGAVVGIPLGTIFGQHFWHVLADSFPLVYASPIALLAVVVAVPAALAVANVLAAGPAHAATRISPAQALRTE